MNEKTTVTEEMMEYARETAFAIQCAEKMADIVGESCGYLPPSLWTEAKCWIKQKLVRTKKSYCHSVTSDDLRKMLYNDILIRMTNSQFKMLMIECGYIPKDATVENWIFQISRQSPVFNREV